jgi:hypothetical protein
LFIPKPVWAVGFALEQTLRDAVLAVFSFADFKTASAYLFWSYYFFVVLAIFVFLLIVFQHFN